MLQNNVTSNPNVGVLYDLCNITAELHRTFTNAYNERTARNASMRNVTLSSNNNPFNVINNFRRICAREIAEVTGA